MNKQQRQVGIGHKTVEKSGNTNKLTKVEEFDSHGTKMPTIRPKASFGDWGEKEGATRTGARAGAEKEGKHTCMIGGQSHTDKGSDRSSRGGAGRVDETS